MNAPNAARLAALYAHVPRPESADCPPLRERRRVGQTWPTVPAAGLDYSTVDVAAALFETGADLAAPTDETTTTDTVWRTLREAVAELGPVAHIETVADFINLDPAEFEEVAQCSRWAHRLALSLWYEDARARPLTIGETAVALYLSTADRYATATIPPAAARLARARQVAAGARLVAPEVLVRLGADLTAEFTPGAHRTGWLHRQALPDHARRAACFHQARADRSAPTPLLVRHDGGALTVGTTPPAPAPHTWARTHTPEW
ncbi:hypothetical protein ACFWMQ_15100 [Streptomyces sp. NPDC058372]|uniref:hypothetical protein n=1 Tax=Streptomyces TaxID=1883 RepID=UPI0033D21329